MPMVGGTFYTKIHGLPVCIRDHCTKPVNRRGGSIDSAFCRAHMREELRALLARGIPFHLARKQMWDERPRERLTFEP